ncbi:MAG TPA: HEAT repeat domain-containing protein [Candidatus Polarisedimenticolia bacterium]|nr:HEAT repeat domain-containing protein [Candidatus Polarisedimenticolia bacterium]
MNCESARRAILLHLYGETDARERFKMDTHLAGCAACADVLSSERRLHAMLQVDAAVEPSDDLLDGCRDALARALDSEAPPAPLPLGLRFFEIWRQVRLSPAYGFAMLAAGFLVGALTLRTAPAGLLARHAGDAEAPAARVVEDRAAARRPESVPVKSVRSLEPASAEGTLRVGYDTLQRGSMEGSAADPAIRAMLVTTLRDSLNSGLRLEAIDALAAHADQADVRQALLDALRRDENAGARLKALDALAARAPEDSQVRGAIVDAMQKDANPGVRVRAIDTLASRRDRRLLPVMERLSRDDPDAYVRMRSGAFVDALYASNSAGKGQ